jgi:L-2-hydroxyglutarate oxidase LhgO
MIHAIRVLKSSIPSSSHNDVLVVGGGVTDLACLRAATLQGWKCALVEAEPDLLSHASEANCGIVCTGVDDTPGSLERAMIQDSISLSRLYCHENIVPTRPCGPLVAWNDNDKTISSSAYQLKLNESQYAGDTHAKLLSTEQVIQDLQEPTCLTIFWQQCI